MIAYCRNESKVHNAGACPREAGHRGCCYWWLAWEAAGAWRVIVYSGEPQERKRRCRGLFTAKPKLEDVNQLVRVIARLKRAELERRTDESEPDPFVIQSGPRGKMEAVYGQLQVL